jgi:hypothetical protein
MAVTDIEYVMAVAVADLVAVVAVVAVVVE